MDVNTEKSGYYLITYLRALKVFLYPGCIATKQNVVSENEAYRCMEFPGQSTHCSVGVKKDMSLQGVTDTFWTGADRASES
jgi:hypothetical protein